MALGRNLPDPAHILQGCQPSKGQVLGARKRKGEQSGFPKD